MSNPLTAGGHPDWKLFGISQAEALVIAQGAIHRLRINQEYQENMRKVREQRRQMDALSDRLWEKLKGVQRQPRSQ